MGAAAALRARRARSWARRATEILLGFFGVGAVGCGLLLPWLRTRLGVERLATGRRVRFALSQLALGLLPRSRRRRSHYSWPAALDRAAHDAEGVGADRDPLVGARARARHAHARAIRRARGGQCRVGNDRPSRGVPHSFALAALAIAFGRAVCWRTPAGGAGPDLEPAPSWPDPRSCALRARSRSGARHRGIPDRPRRRRSFARAMRWLRSIRLRDGAIRWGLWDDLAQTRRFLESFVVESWLEHLRQHGASPPPTARCRRSRSRSIAAASLRRSAASSTSGSRRKRERNAPRAAALLPGVFTEAG